MQMKTILANLDRFRAPRLDLPQELSVARAAGRIAPATVEIRAVEPPDLDAISIRIRESFANGEPPKPSDLRYAPWCIWDGDYALEYAPDVLNAYLRHVRETRRRSSYRRLAAAYAIRFPTRSRMLKAVGATLSHLAEILPGAWSEASKALRIFDPEAAPKEIARAALVFRISPAALLSRHGLSNLAANAGLAEASFLAGLEEIQGAVMEPSARLDAVMRWSLNENGHLIFDNHRGCVADALVLPHVESTPDKPQRDSILAFLIQYFRDPRLPSDRWIPMSEACKATVRRWLIEQSLRQFLDVVDENALDKQWKYRRAFWLAVYEKGLIADACVVFDEAGATTARQIFDTDTLYSRWRSGGSKQIDRGHACLILRVGSGVIAEWSHNGRCYIWRDASDPTAPKLHNKTYNSDEVMFPKGHEQSRSKSAYSHWSPDTYYWQEKVADEVYNLTKSRIMMGDYRVK